MSAYRTTLLEKIKGKSAQEIEEEERRKRESLINTDPQTFHKIPAWYHADDRQQQVLGKTSRLPDQSPLKKTYNERMKSFVKDAFEAKKK